MDFVLVLMFAYLSTGQSEREVTEQKGDLCYNMCPAGYHKVGEDCDDQVAKHRCKECSDGKFTALENFVKECHKCGSCGNYEVKKKSCTSISDVECDCKRGYFSKASYDSSDCSSCSCDYCKHFDLYPDFKKKCQPCQSCLESSECQKKCPFSLFTNSSTAATTSASASASASTSTAARTIKSNHPVVDPFPRHSNEMHGLILVVVLVILLLFLWLLLLFARSPFRYPDSCLCWSVNKDLQPPLEDPRFNEQSSHQGSSPDTLTLNISENTPMMTLSQSPAMPEHPAHISPLDAEHKAVRQHSQSDQWPAIVLYAIIKEVPLRRWKEFLRLLSLTDQQLERVELEAGLGLGSIERQYQMLRLWSQCSSARLNDVFSALHYMDLSGCAQLLQESLEKLQLAGLN